MNNELLAVIEYWEREKGIQRDVLIAAVQNMLVAAARKAMGPARDLTCTIDPKTGEIRASAKLIVTDKVISKHDQISLAEARRYKPDAQLGEEVVVPIGAEQIQQFFGRIASQYGRQALMQEIRKAEKQLILEEFKDRVGDIVAGTVRRFERSDVIVDLGRYEALLPNRERVPTEEYQPGERLRAYVKAVENTPHGPEIILSRADPRFVLRLFQLEVTEIADGTIEIRGIAREPGFRTKLAVYSRDPKVDPVGACVGLRGQRVKNIVRELNNERVDIIPWSPDLRTFIAAALNPATIRRFEVDEANHRVHVLVNADQLSQAIGKRGQNARLTSRLCGWEVDIDAEAPVSTGFEEKVAQAIQALAAIPGISEAQADALVHHGFLTLEDLLQAEESDLAAFPEIGQDAAAVLAAARAEAERRVVNINPAPATPSPAPQS
jgi:N utilization substance protein A